MRTFYLLRAKNGGVQSSLGPYRYSRRPEVPPCAAELHQHAREVWGSTKRAGPLHAPPRARAQRELAGWPALAFRGGDGGVPSRRLMASAVHVFKLPRF